MALYHDLHMSGSNLHHLIPKTVCYWRGNYLSVEFPVKTYTSHLHLDFLVFDHSAKRSTTTFTFVTQNLPGNAKGEISMGEEWCFLMEKYLLLSPGFSISTGTIHMLKVKHMCNCFAQVEPYAQMGYLTVSF